MNLNLKQVPSFLHQQRKIILLAGILIVLFAGILYSIMLGDELRFLPDERDYLVLAKNISRYRIYAFPIEQSPIWSGPTPHDLVYTAYRAPGYPFFLAIFVWMGATVAQLRIVNFILLAVSIYLVYLILENWSKKKNSLASTAGVVMILVYPVLIYAAGTLYPQILGGMLFLLVLYMLSLPGPNHYTMIIAGITWGYLVLTIPIFLFTLPLIAVWMILDKKFSTRLLLIFIILGLIVVGIWTVRNYRIFGEFVMISSNFGVNLALGNSEFTIVNAATDVDFLQKWPIMHELTEMEQNRYLRQEAWKFISDQPGQAVKLYGLKFLNYFNFQNKLASNQEMLSWHDWIMLLSYGMMMIIFALRLVFIKRFPLNQNEVLLLAIYLGSALVSAVFFTRIRLRLPFDFVLVLYNALFLGRLVTVEDVSQETQNQV